MDELKPLYDLATPILIGIVAYFIRGTLLTLKQLEKDFATFREQYAGHRVATEENRERLEKLEKKVDEIDSRWLAFYMEQQKKNT